MALGGPCWCRRDRYPPSPTAGGEDLPRCEPPRSAVVNPPARELLGGLVDSLDVVVTSDDELALLAPGAGVEEQARWLLEGGVTEVVVKLRAAGRWPTPVRRSFAVRPGRRRGRLRSRISLRRAGRPSGPGTAGKANAVGTFVVGTRGEWEGLPTRRELSMLDRGQGEVVR